MEFSLVMKYYCLDGKLVDPAEAQISIKDRCVLYGEGLFETIRVHKGRALFIDKHLERLNKSCTFLCIDVDIAKVRGAVNDFIAANEIDEGSLRLTVTGGYSKEAGQGTGATVNSGAEGTFFITGQMGRKYLQEDYSRGYTGFISSIKRIDSFL